MNKSGFSTDFENERQKKLNCPEKENNFVSVPEKQK